MSERIDKFCESLRTKLNDLDTRMESLKSTLRSAPKQAQDALHRQLDTAKQKVESQKQAIAKARTNVQEWADQRKVETKATVNQWKANREAKKLAHRADRAEDYAIAAVLVAVASMDDAEQAVFEAITARLDAEELQPVGQKSS